MFSLENTIASSTWGPCLYASYIQSTESLCECSRRLGKVFSLLQSSVFIYTAVLRHLQGENSGPEIRDENKIRGLFEDCCAVSCVLGSQQGWGSKDFQSLPLCDVKGPSTKWIVLRAWGCGRGYNKVLPSCCEGWMCSPLQGSYLEPLIEKE